MSSKLLSTSHIALFLLLVGVEAHANDASITLTGGTVRIVEAENVELVEERLVFTHQGATVVPPPVGYRCDEAGDSAGWRGTCDGGAWCQDDTGLCHRGPRWNADLTYVLRNNSDTPVTLDVGLPFQMPELDWEHHGPNIEDEISEFATWLDDRVLHVERIDGHVEQTLGEHEIEFNRVYHSQVTLQPGQLHSLRHRYTTYSGQSAGGNDWFDYLLRTGSSWSGNIGRVRIDFQLPPANGPCAHTVFPYERVGDWVRITLEDWDPDRDFHIAWAPREVLTMMWGDWEDYCSYLEQADDDVREQRLAAVELFFGAPHEGREELAARGPMHFCSMADGFAYLLHEGFDTSAIVYREDPHYPSEMPAELQTCIAEIRAQAEADAEVEADPDDSAPPTSQPSQSEEAE